MNLPIVESDEEPLEDDDGTLDFRMEELKRVPDAELVDYLPAFTAAVDELHGVGVVHNDLSGRNFMLDCNGRVKFIDLVIREA